MNDLATGRDQRALLDVVTRIERRDRAAAEIVFRSGVPITAVGLDVTSQLKLREKDLDRIYAADDLANGQNIIFCATGISDSALLRGVRARGGVTAVTHSILMRAKSKTVRFIRAQHDLQIKTIRLRSDNREHIL